MSKIFLSLIIPTHNSQNTTPNLLLSIDQSNFHNFDEIETIITDDGSKDNTVAVIKKMVPQLKFKLKIIGLKKNIGPAKARNFGVKNARGKFVVFLDSDVILKKKSLQIAFDLFKKGRVRAFTGIWDYRQNTSKFFPQFKALRDWSYWFVERQKNSRYYLFSTRIAGIEKSLFQKLEGFREDYPEPTVEDIELTYRIEKKTGISFCPKIIVSHEFEDFPIVAAKYFKRSRDWIQLYFKRYRFDPVATTQNEATKSLIASFFIFTLCLSPLSLYYVFLALVLLIVLSLMERKFWFFLYKKKGVSFLAKGVLTSILLYFIITLGAFDGLLVYLKKKLA